ncbi:hypothetical protein [Nocardiopsis sp. NPDC006938]|uniref:hypothetical protein n=1 Tax=Nocardiopsis sp. NPDC006938 TaxID=3364337 RepID=UPI00368E713F
MIAQRKSFHLVTVGVSIIDHLQTPRAELKKYIPDTHEDHHQLRARIWKRNAAIYDKQSEEIDLEKDSELASEELENILTRRSGEEYSTSIELIEFIKPKLWPREVSAELSAVASLNGTTQIPSDDTAILVASDTRKGLRAALLNAAAMAGGRLDRVRYFPEPTSDIAEEEGNVIVVRLPGLDARDEDRLIEAMRGLGALGLGIRDLLHQHMGSMAHFHLSGGFKTALPFFLGLAEAMQGLCGRGRIRAHTIHETSRDLRSVVIPLRSHDAELLREQLASARYDGYYDDDPPNGRPLNGYAYTREDSKWRLTPYGFILRPLFVDHAIPPHES